MSNGSRSEKDIMDGMVEAQGEILENLESLKGVGYTKAVHMAATYSGLLRMCQGILHTGMSEESTGSPDHLFTEILALVLLGKYDEAKRARPETEMVEFTSDVNALQRHVCAHITRDEPEDNA